MSEIRTTVTYEGTERGREQLEGLLTALGEVKRGEDAARSSTRGLEQAASSLADEVRRAAGEARRGAEETEKLGDKAGGTKQRLEVTAFSANAFGGALGQLSQTMRGLGPSFEGLSSGLDSVSHGLSVAQSMPGPLGLALGGLTTAFGVLSHATEQQSEEFGRLEREAVGARTEIEETIASINRFNQRRRIFSGQATSQEIGASIGDVQARIQGRQAELEGTRGGLAEARAELQFLEGLRASGEGGAGERGLGAGRSTGQDLENRIARAERAVLEREQRIAALTGSLSSARRELEQLREAEDTAATRESEERTQDAEGERRAREHQRRGPRDDSNEFDHNRVTEYYAAIQRGHEQREAALAREREIEQEMIALQKRGDDEHQAALDKATDGARELVLAAEAEFAAREAAIEQLERQKDKERELAEQRLESAREITGRIGDTLQTVASAYIDAFGKAIEGQMTLEEATLAGTKTILKGLGEEMVGIGIRETLEGFANIVSNPPVAATKIPMGIALIGAGVGLGAAGAAIPSGSSAAPERPRAEEERGGEGGNQTLVINNNYPIVSTGTHNQLARQMSRQIRDPEFPTRLAA